MTVFYVVMKPKKGNPQTFEGDDGFGNAVKRPLERRITVAAEDEAEARFICDTQARDLAVPYLADDGVTLVTADPYVIASVETIG